MIVKDIIKKKKQSLKLENEVLRKELNKALLELTAYKNQEISAKNTLRKKIFNLEKRIEILERNNLVKNKQRINKVSGK